MQPEFKNKILQGDSLTILKTLPSESIDCITTSPPYWALRDYKVDGQIGNEKTIDEYITKLINVFNECKRILKKEGTCWVVMGDTYSGNVKAGNKVFGNPEFNKNRPSRALTLTPEKKTGLQDKTLCMIPERFALKMIENKWILRNKIIWYKPNCMPSSAKDRFTVDFENIYFFTKSQRYYFKTQYEPLLTEPHKPGNKKKYNEDYTRFFSYDSLNKTWGNPNGRIKRCVWKISTKPFSGASLLADYVGENGRPYKASPNCPIHGHLVSQQVPCKVLYDEQSTSQLNHNPDKLNGHVSRLLNEYDSKTLNSNDIQISEDSSQQIPNNIPYNKNNHERVLNASHIHSCASKTSDHTKNTHILSKPVVDSLSCLNHDDSQTAISHNKQNHKNILSKEQHDISYDKKLYDKFDTPQEVAEILSFNDNKITTDKCVCSIITIDHFAVFPEELAKQCLDAGCPSGGTTLDPFMGSGTVALVALKNAMNFVGIELNTDYIKIAEKRLEPYLKQEKLTQFTR